MKLILNIVALASMPLLLFSGLLHGASVYGAIAGMLEGGSPLSVLINYVAKNCSDPIFISSLIFVILYFVIAACCSCRTNCKFVGVLTPNVHLVLSLFVYIGAAIICGATVYFSAT